jgi:hypothetical protein
VGDSPTDPIPFAAQAVPFQEMLATGKIPAGLITSPYVADQFAERLVHYVLSVPAGNFTMASLGKVLEQLDPPHQVFFFKKLKETSPQSLKHFAPLYYGFMSEFSDLLFT